MKMIKKEKNKGGFMGDKILFFIAIWGEIIGISLIALVSFWDFLTMGTRGILNYQIDWPGVITIWIGSILIILSKHLNKIRW